MYESVTPSVCCLVWIAPISFSFMPSRLPGRRQDKAVPPSGSVFPQYSWSSAPQLCGTDAQGGLKKKALHLLCRKEAANGLRSWWREANQGWKHARFCRMTVSTLLHLGPCVIPRHRQELFQRAKHLYKQSTFVMHETFNGFLISSQHNCLWCDQLPESGEAAFSFFYNPILMESSSTACHPCRCNRIIRDTETLLREHRTAT